MKPIRDELEVLYDLYGQQFYACALAITGNGDLAEDAVHDAFHRAFKIQSRPDNFKAYLFQSVRNAAIDIHRKDTRESRWRIETVGEFSVTESSSSVENHEEFQRVLTAMEKMKESQREIVMHHLVGGMKFREIAALRSQPLGTVTAEYHRGMNKLRAQLETHDG